MVFVQYCPLFAQGSTHSFARLLLAVGGGERGRRMHLIHIPRPGDALGRLPYLTAMGSPHDSPPRSAATDQLPGTVPLKRQEALGNVLGRWLSCRYSKMKNCGRHRGGREPFTRECEEADFGQMRRTNSAGVSTG